MQVTISPFSLEMGFIFLCFLKNRHEVCRYRKHWMDLLSLV